MGHASGVFTIGLLAAFGAPREAKAVGYFTDNTATSLGIGSAQTACSDSIISVTLTAGATTTPDYGCYTSWLESVDIDGDGDFDIIEANGGGYYAINPTGGNGDEESLVYLNDGHGVFQDATATAFGNAHSRLRQTAIGDVNGDGLLDLYEPGGFGQDLDKLFIQTSPGFFTNEAADLLPAGLSSHASSAHLGDVDGDGDLDLVVGDWGNAATTNTARLILYTNDGTGKFTLAGAENDPQFALPTDVFPPTIPYAANVSPDGNWGVRPLDIDLADVDGDFDLDILVDMRNGYSRIFLNDGTGHFTDGTNWHVVTNPDSTTTVVTNYPAKQGPYVYNQELCDVDGDGDLDLLLDNAGPKPTSTSKGNYTQILLNDGHGVFTDNTANMIFGEPGADDNAVKCLDVNNDGYMDLITVSLANTSEKLFINNGLNQFNYVSDGFPTIQDESLGIDVADFNGDGLLDVVTGQGEGSYSKDGTNLTTLHNNRIYFGGGASMADTIPPVFREVETPTITADTPTVIRAAVKDRVTSEVGQEVTDVTLNYTVTGSAEKHAKGKFIGGDIFRMVLPAQPPGTQISYYLSTTDRSGNATETDTVDVTLPTPPPPGTGGTTGTGEGGEAGVGQAGTSQGGEAGGGGVGTGPVGPGLGGTAGISGTSGAGGTVSVGTSGSSGTSGTSGTSGSGNAAAGEAGAPAETGGTKSSGGGGTSAGTGGTKASSGSSGKGGSSGTSAKGGSGGKGGSSSTSEAGEGGIPGEAGGGTGGSKSAPPPAKDNGCSCSVVQTPENSEASLLGFGLALLGFVRRRRNTKK